MASGHSAVVGFCITAVSAAATVADSKPLRIRNMHELGLDLPLLTILPILPSDFYYTLPVQ